MSGVFPLFGSLTGLPLEDLVYLLNQNNMVVDWIDFYREGLKHGWKEERMLERIKLSVSETYGQKQAEETVRRLKKIAGL